MILLLLASLLARIVEQCGIDNEGVTLVKYYQKWCPACQRLDPVLQEIDSRLERHNANIKVQKIDCSDCGCNEDIKSYPTVKLMEGNKEIAKFSGYKSYAEVASFLQEHKNVDKKVFEGHVEKQSGVIYELTNKDLYNGLDGPWVVLFYQKDHEMFDSLLEQIAKIYDGQVNIARISYYHSQDFVKKFGIKGLPAIYGFLDGLTVPYLEALSLNELAKFIDKLTATTLTDITYDGFLEKIKVLEAGEPIYIVMNRNPTLTMNYFYKYAHEYKFRVNMYRSEDERLFQRSSLYPKEISDDAHHSEHGKAAILTVYKNGMFFPFEGDIADESEVNEWIFHTHFSYVTNITNTNFGNIFHGIKPVMLLLSSGEQLVAEFNDFSADRHLGTPFSDILYAVIDTDDFNLFVPSLLPKMSIPSLVFYDPLKRLFYYKRLPLDHQNFYSSAMTLLKLYENGKLSTYPPKASYLKYYILAAGLFTTALGIYISRTKQKKRI